MKLKTEYYKGYKVFFTKLEEYKIAYIVKSENKVVDKGIEYGTKNHVYAGIRHNIEIGQYNSTATGRKGGRK